MGSKMNRKKYKAYLIDLDGTMYNGNEKIEEAAGFIKRLRRAEKPFLFLTNNSTASPLEVSKNLKERSNVEAYPEEVYTSSHATISYLKKMKAEEIYLIGDQGLLEEFHSAGFTLRDEEVDTVVVGYDHEVTFEELKTASLLIQEGARFIGTNPDTNIPTEEGLIPGNGALLAFIEAATNRKPRIMGKPEATMMEGALKKLGFEKNDVLMIGDNYTTDIQAGIQNGIDSLLVLTGFTSREDLETVRKSPDYIINHLDEWKIKQEIKK